MGGSHPWGEPGCLRGLLTSGTGNWGAGGGHFVSTTLYTSNQHKMIRNVNCHRKIKSNLLSSHTSLRSSHRPDERRRPTAHGTASTQTGSGSPLRDRDPPGGRGAAKRRTREFGVKVRSGVPLPVAGPCRLPAAPRGPSTARMNEKAGKPGGLKPKSVREGRGGAGTLGSDFRAGSYQTSAAPACSPQNLLPAAATILQNRFFFAT